MIPQSPGRPGKFIPKNVFTIVEDSVSRESNPAYENVARYTYPARGKQETDTRVTIKFSQPTAREKRLTTSEGNEDSIGLGAQFMQHGKEPSILLCQYAYIRRQ